MFDPFLSDYRPQDNSRVAVFGEILGQKSLSDVQDLLAVIRYKMMQMATALGQVNPMTVKDSAAFAALMVDAGNLKTRVSRADAQASAVLNAAVVIPTSTTPAMGLYETVAKSMRQGGEKAQIQRGDFDDVVNRLKQVAGVSVDLSNVPRAGSRTFLDNISANLPDIHLPHLPDIPHTPDLPDLLDPFHIGDLIRWVRDHKTEVTIVACLVGGLILYKMWIGTKYVASVAVERAPQIAAYAAKHGGKYAKYAPLLLA